MAKKVIKIKRVDGVSQGYHVGSDVSVPTAADSIAAHPAGKGLVEDKVSAFDKFEQAVKIAGADVDRYGKPRIELPMPEVQYYKPVLEDAVSKGWTLSAGPWGHSGSDRSVIVEKYFPELEGKFSVHFVDRDWKNLEGSKAYEADGPYSLDRHTNAWFVGDTKPGYAYPEHALNVEDCFENGSIDEDKLVVSAGTCDVCKKNVGRLNLKHVAFANNACPDCTPGLRDKLETPGWYN